MSKTINLDEKLECKGYWWLPNNPNETVAGVLTYIPDEKILLELIGAFDSKKDFIDTLLNENSEDIIHGLTSDSKELTLVNCHSVGSLNFSCPFPIMKYSCQFLIIGKHLNEFKQKCFYKAYITIPELSYWCSPCALKTTISIDKDDNDISTTTISFKSKSVLINSVPIDDNTTIKIEGGVNYVGDYFSPNINQHTYIEILKQDNSSIEDFYANIFMFEQFLSLATLHTVNCSKILLYDKTVFQEYNNGQRFYHPIQFFYIQRKVNMCMEIKKHDFLFDYNLISEQYPKIIHKWYNDKEDIAPIRAHLIDSIQNTKIFSSIDFLIVVQALEGFCTRFRTEANLTKMLEAIISEFSDIDKLKDDNIKIKQVVDSRHYYSHFMNKSKKPNTLDGWKLYNLTFKLRKLLICCILKFIGFNNTQINQILNNSHSNLLHK